MTKQLLEAVLAATTSVCYNAYESALFSGIFSLAFYGMFRISELVASTCVSSKLSTSLRKSHIACSKDSNGQYLKVKLTRSKTVQEGPSVDIVIREQQGTISCPVLCVKAYKKARPKSISHYFAHSDGAQVTTYQVNRPII